MQTFNLWTVAQQSRALRTNPVLGYPIAFLLVCLAVAARLLAGSTLAAFPILPFYPAVVLAAFLCGPAPASLAAFLGAVLSILQLADSSSPVHFKGGDLAVAIGFYACTTGLIIALMHLMLKGLERQHATARRLELAMNAGGMAVWEYNLAREEIVATQELNQLLGFPPRLALTVAQVESLVPPREWERLRHLARRAIAARDRFFELEFQVRRPDESLHWFALNAEILRGANDAPQEIMGVLTDITARKNVEQGLGEAVARLKEREQELEAVMDVTGVAPFDFDPQNLTFKHSPRLNRLYGFPDDHQLTIRDLRGRYFPPEGEDYVQEANRRVADTGLHAYELDIRLKMPDGNAKWLNGRGEYIRDQAGKAVRSRGVVMDITARKELEQTRELLLRELDHRIKNLLATVGAIGAQTLRGNISLEQARANLDGRLQVLARAHELLTNHQWHDMDMREVVKMALSPHHASHLGRAQIAVEGPSCLLTPRRGLALTLALHELATNAIKYGALSVAGGQVSVSWRILHKDGADRLEFAWREKDGPPVAAPSRRGFGTRIIERVLASDFAGQARLDYRPDGLCCTLDCPLVCPWAASPV